MIMMISALINMFLLFDIATSKGGPALPPSAYQIAKSTLDPIDFESVGTIVFKCFVKCGIEGLGAPVRQWADNIVSDGSVKENHVRTVAYIHHVHGCREVLVVFHQLVRDSMNAIGHWRCLALD